MTEAEITTGAALRAGLESLRRTHDTFEDDCFYACPKSGESCNAEQDPDHCSCGADRQNAVVDQLLIEAARVEANRTALRHALVELASIVNALALAQRLQPDGDRTVLQGRLSAALLAAEAAVGIVRPEGGA